MSDFVKYCLNYAIERGWRSTVFFVLFCKLIPSSNQNCILYTAIFSLGAVAKNRTHPKVRTAFSTQCMAEKLPAEAVVLIVDWH